MTDAEITRLLASLLLRPLRPAERRQLADILDRLAAQQRELADADSRVGHVARRAALDSQPRSPKGGRPKGSGARFIRIETRPRGIGAFIHIGRALWQELGEPKRIDIQRVDGQLLLIPVAGDAGYAVSRPKNGMPRTTIGEETRTTIGLDDGRYAAEIRAGLIVVGERME